jgi:hypothetical protein
VLELCCGSELPVQESTDIRTKRMHSVVALVGWILFSQCSRSNDTYPQHHEKVSIHAGGTGNISSISSVGSIGSVVEKHPHNYHIHSNSR